MIHACSVGEIGRSVILGSDEHTVALGCCEIYHFGGRRFGVYAINLNDLHCMAFKPDIVSGKARDVDDAEQVSLSRLDSRRKVLRVVEQGRLWHWLRAGRVGHAHEALEHVGHELMVPV